VVGGTGCGRPASAAGRLAAEPDIQVTRRRRSLPAPRGFGACASATLDLFEREQIDARSSDLLDLSLGCNGAKLASTWPAPL
jgi:hypothetical protein